MTITLYVDQLWISPYAYSAFVTLEEKEIPYTVETVSLSEGAHLGDEYRNLSLTGRVPAIDHDGYGLAESSAIVEYLDEVFPGVRVIPEDPRERARARQIMAWLRSDLLALREERPTSTMFHERATRPLTPRGRSAADKLIAVASALIPDDERVTIGSAWSIADADLGFALQRLILNNDSVPSRIQRYAEAQWARPSIMKFVAQERTPPT